MYLSLVFIVMLVSGTFIIMSITNQENERAREELEQYAVYIEEQVIDQYDDPARFADGLSSLFITNLSQKNLRSHILDKNGETVASSLTKDSESYLSFTNSAVISALSGEDEFIAGKREADRNGQVKEWLSYAKSVKDADGNVDYVIYVQMDGESIKQSLSRVTSTILIAVLLAIVLAAVVGVLFANTITGPIIVLTKKANQLAKGKLEQHATVKSNDEIGQLTRSFNTMARELRKNVTEVENQRDKLEIVLHNMTDGVLAFDENGILIHANKICYDMLEMDNVVVSLDWLLEKLSLDRSRIKGGRELVVSEDGRYISVALVPYSSGNKVSGVIVVLHDITRHRQLDDMRKEFVANVSHEIGTPLTTIKGYAELLLDGAIDDKDVAMDFLKEIDVAADRMKLLRDDLLDLSRFDTKVNKFDLERTNLVDLISGCVRQNVVVASQKNQTITFKPSDEPMYIMADAARVNQAITNIISNAVKYSPEKATIRIRVKASDKHYFVSIADNGIGMPKEALDRIFDRFYRVDKARSRQMGGNGLGLAIVKEIMDAHHGAVKVQSEEGKGTVMTLVFPKAV
jgi:two-component system sensor histidine kinase VicK